MKRIFISTNYNRLNGLFGQPGYEAEKQKLIVKGINNLVDHLYYSEELKVFNKDSTESLLILLNDEKVRFNIDVDDSDILLHHSKTEEHLKDVLKLFSKTRPGAHMLGNEFYYEPVFNIILDEKPDKAERIINCLFPPELDSLEFKLELLHQCLTPEGLNSVNSDYLKKYPLEIKSLIIDAEGKYIGHLKKLEEVKETGPFGDKYIKALSDLRDELLKNY